MKEIALTNSHLTVQVDDCDFDELNKHKWRLDERGYAIRRQHVCRDKVTKQKKTRIVQMHRQIMGFPDSLVDHGDGVRLRNTRENLREATATQNQQNRGKQKNNTTGFKGVTLHKKAGKYIAHIGVKGKTIYLGLFDCPKNAARVYNEAALKYHDFPKLNEIE